MPTIYIMAQTNLMTEFGHKQLCTKNYRCFIFISALQLCTKNYRCFIKSPKQRLETYCFCSVSSYYYYTPCNKVVGGYTGFTMSVRLSVRLQTNPMSYDNLSCVPQNLLKFYQLFTGEERRIPFIFDNFHFCRSRVIGLDMTENRIFTLCRMIT